MEERRQREKRRRRRRKLRSASLKEGDELRQDEEEQNRDRDRAGRREKERVDRRRQDPSAQCFVALELGRKPCECRVDVAAAFAGTHESYVDRREERRMLGESGRKSVATFDARLYLEHGGANITGGDVRRRLERLRQRHSHRQQRGERARNFENLAL